MATGDILSVTIDSSGWFAIVKVEGLGVGGTYDFGVGAKNDFSNAAIILSLTSQGYNTTPALGTIARTVYGVPCVRPDTGAMRLPYPDEADPDETVSGSDVDIVIALSDYVYSADASITVDFLSAWYIQGTASNSVTDLSVTNNSTAVYQIPVGNWAYPGYSKVTEDFYVEFTAFHRDDIIAVVISATDGSITVSEVITDLEISPKNDYSSVLVYRSLIDVSGFNDGIITVDAIVYPKVGNASSLLDTSDAVNIWPTPLYASHKYRLDTGDNHGFTVVDPTNGNDGTGVVYSSQVLAEAGLAYQTTSAALTAVQAYHNANAGHNDAGCGTILCTEDTILHNGTQGGTLTEWVEFRPVSTAIRANVLMTPGASNSAIPDFMKIVNMTINGAGWFSSGGTDCIWFDECDCQLTGILSTYGNPFCAATYCIGTWPSSFKQFSTAKAAWHVRGCDLDTAHETLIYMCVGNRNAFGRERGNTGTELQKNVLYAFNVTDVSTLVGIILGQNDPMDNVAIVQNLFVRYGLQSLPLITAGFETSTSENVIFWHNSTVGARSNIGYSVDAASIHTFYSFCNNLWSDYNCKSDIFSADGSAINNWAVRYNIGSNGNFFRTSVSDTWFGEFSGVGANKGTQSTPLEPLYVDDQSADGGDTSGGDYHLQETSPARELIQRQVLPFDLDGRSRRPDGSVGSLEYYAIASPDDLILSSIILESPIVSAVVSPDNLILSAIILEQTSIGGTISPDDLILSSIILDSPGVSGIISPDNLVLSSIILEQAAIIPVVAPENLVLSAIILEQTKQSGEIVGPISISISLSKKNISMNISKSDISISLKKSNISMELNT